MPRQLAILLLLLVCVAAALTARPAPAAAAAAPVLGIGEQKASMFTNRYWSALSMRDARYNAPYDVLHDPYQLALLDAWLAQARLNGIRPLIGFTHSLRARYVRRLPSPLAYAIEFKRFRERYPWVRDYIVWNEANNPGAMTANKPGHAARFFDAVRRNCRSCRIVAADVLDTPNMKWWVARFVQKARYHPTIWGLHNYGDVNGLKVKSTRRLLTMVRGRIWFTETGGLVSRRLYSPTGKVLKRYRYSLRHAAQSTRHALRLACMSPRVERVYLYHWQAPRRVTNWDSGLLDHKGRRRPAYFVVRRWQALKARVSQSGARRKLCASTT